MEDKSNKARLAGLCKKLSSEVSDEHGFVSTNTLLNRFRAKAILRPLLVEGMLASTDDPNFPWVVLIDSEQYGNDLNDVFGSPANKRLRNTIAHELSHSLAFRLDEFGLSLQRESKRSQSKEEFVREIEQETESLSPLLLLCESSLKQLSKTVSIENMTSFRDNHGVSNYTLINRLLNIPHTSLISEHKGITNCAIGICKSGYLEPWPLFYKFDNNILPDFIHLAKAGNRIKLSDHFTKNDFVLNGGSNRKSNSVTSAGTTANPSSQDLEMSIELEDSQRSGLILLTSQATNLNTKSVGEFGFIFD